MNEQPVFYFTRFLPAYRLPIVERLNERLNNRLIVCHGQPPPGNSVVMNEVPPSINQIRLKNYWFRKETAHLQFYRKVFKQFGKPSVVLAEESPRSLLLPGLLRYARRNSAGRVLWGFFYSTQRAYSATHPLQRYRIGLAKTVEACACYSRQSRTYLAPHIAAERLFVAQNTVDTDTLFDLRKKLAARGKTVVRNELGFDAHQPIIIFVGQLTAKKGVMMLLDVFERFRKGTPASLVIIGAGPERSNMESRVSRSSIPDVHFLGEIPSLESSAPYLFASDVLVMPGYVGLAVNHAFSLGLPVVTQRAPEGVPFHSPEVESIEHGENGMFSGWDNDDSMLDAIRQVVDQQAAFSARATSYAETNLTIGRMIDALEAAIVYAHDHKGE